MLHKIIFVLACWFLINCTGNSSTEASRVYTPIQTQTVKDSVSLAGLLNPLTDKMKSGTGVYVLEDGVSSLTSRAWLCDAAKKTIDIQYYIFSKDNTGLIASDFLVRAADRGVKIRMLIDDITVKAGSKELFTLDSHENIEIKIYNPGVKIGTLGARIKKLVKNFNKIHRRMHNKTITVDDQVAITGGRNIADEYYDFDKEYNFRDRDVLLIGKTIPDVKSSFELFWKDDLSVKFEDLVKEKKENKNNKNRFDKLHAYAADTKNLSSSMRQKIRNFPATFKAMQESGELLWVKNVSFVADIPGKNENRPNREGGICTDSIMALITQAKTSIDIQSPYLILTDVTRKLFHALVQRGVKVRILTNSLASTDNHEAFSGYERDRKLLLQTGIEIYEFKPDAKVRYKIMNDEVQSTIDYKAVYGLHAKTLVIDNVISVIGSYNLDPRSANLNTECVAIIRSPEVSKNVLKHLNEEFLPENAWRTTLDYNPDKEASNKKRIKVASRKIIPKDIL
ncbi:MAG: phospholipase D family protein [Bacteroidetes bacterium]|nr:phospholipase D family protein [Bacteroidota bacterium]